MKYKLYLDKDEKFECESEIKNASYKNSKARLIISSENSSVVFEGTVHKSNIEVPIKSSVLNKLYDEEDSADIRLEVIVENTILEPWSSDVSFEKYNKVEISEVKNIVETPSIEISVKNDTTTQEEKNVISEVETETEVGNEKALSKEVLLEEFNKMLKTNNLALSKKEKIKLFKNFISKVS